MFTEFDVFVCVVILISLIASLMRGAVRDVFSLISWIGAAALTLLLYPQAILFVNDLVEVSIVINVITIILLYLISFFIFNLISSLIVGRIEEFNDSRADKILGGIFGLVKGLAIVSIIHFCIIQVANDVPDWLGEGETFKLTKSGSDLIAKFANDDEVQKTLIEKITEEE